MAYSPGTLSLVAGSIAGDFRLWVYKSADAVAVVNSAGYFADAGIRGMRVNDLVIAIDTDDSAVNFLTVNAISSGAADTTDGLAVGTTDTD